MSKRNFSKLEKEIKKLKKENKAIRTELGEFYKIENKKWERVLLEEVQEEIIDAGIYTKSMDNIFQKHIENL